MSYNSNLIYYSILLATILKSFSYIPLIYSIENTNISQNIPYNMLYMDFLAAIILLVISFQRNFLFHVFLFIIYLLSILVIFYKKYNSNN